MPTLKSDFNSKCNSILSRCTFKNQRFFDKLKRIHDFELVLCRMQKVKIDGKTIYQVKEDDIHLAVDMVKLAHNNAYDTAILVSSDGDFVPAIQAVKEIGKKVENIGFETKFSYYLKQECDRFRKLIKREVEVFFI
ncbi:NYN domain-containing protein [Candidatus Pacearchaeota archaeon]|nr:NYN domain-containing protein [Candidatus Pacearchaeota archaeon]